jgi:sulfur carrier protein
MTEPKIALRFNGEVLEVPMGTTIAELLERSGIRSRLVAVEVNLEIVPHEQHDAHQVQAGDTIEVVTLVGGG